MCGKLLWHSMQKVTIRFSDAYTLKLLLNNFQWILELEMWIPKQLSVFMSCGTVPIVLLCQEYFWSIWLMSNIWIYVASCVCSTGQPTSMAKMLTVDIACKLFNQIVSFLLCLTLAGSHKVSTKQNLLASFSCTLFNLSRRILKWCWSNLSWTSWYYFLNES